jgi:hypothetical protein
MIRVPGPGHCSLGAWGTERAAAEAYDRAVLYYRGPQVPRNFPRRRLVPTAVRALQAEARALAKQSTSSSFRGVVRAAASWVAQIRVHGRNVGLGHWPTEIAAAVAYDRAVGFYRLDKRTLNFPSRRLSPLAAPELRRAASLARKLDSATSRYRGVFLAGQETSRPWLAQITIHGRRAVSLGTWETERDAACAYDRAARHYDLPESVLNFPAEKMPPSTPAALVSEARRQGKLVRTSRYIGVSWSAATEQWRAQIGHLSRNIYLGLFAGERRAAKAYDNKAIALRGRRALINFHPETGEVVTGQRLSALVSPENARRGVVDR